MIVECRTLFGKYNNINESGHNT